MALVRTLLEHLILFLFGVARVALLAQGLAMLTAALAASSLGRPDSPPWFELALRSTRLVSATLLVAGIALIAARRLPLPREEPGVRSEWFWPALLGLSMAVLAELTYLRATDLFSLWREISGLLDQAGFWEVLRRSDPFGGIVIFPILAALFVPGLETAAAFFLVAVPLAMLLLLAARSRVFARMFAMLVACQAGFVIAALLSAGALSTLVAEFNAAMLADADADVHRVAALLARLDGVLVATSRAFVAPAIGFAAWLPFLVFSRWVGNYFTAGATSPSAGVSPSFAAVSPSAAASPSFASAAGSSSAAGDASTTAATAGTATAAPPRAQAQLAGRMLLALGLFMLAFAASELLRSRAGFSTSEPAPGQALAAAPAAVRVRFDREIDAASSLSVTRIPVRPGPGESAAIVATSRGLDPSDPERRSLRADLAAVADGLYRVAWNAMPASGGVPRHGAFHFTVGAAAAASAPAGAAVEESDASERGRRSTFVGGVILVVLGLLTPRLPRRR